MMNEMSRDKLNRKADLLVHYEKKTREREACPVGFGAEIDPKLPLAERVQQRLWAEYASLDHISSGAPEEYVDSVEAEMALVWEAIHGTEQAA